MNYNCFYIFAQIELFPPGNPNGIVRPNSMWTAGCCMKASGPESIAVIGNNDFDKSKAGTQSMSLATLEKLLAIKKPANLFPAFPGCRSKSFDLNLL